MSDQLDMPAPVPSAPKNTDMPESPEPPRVPQQRVPEGVPTAGPETPISPVPTPPQDSRRRLGLLIGAIVAAVALIVGVTVGAIYILKPTPTEHLADVVRAVSSDSAPFKHADDDTIATSMSKGCSLGGLVGLRPGPLLWSRVAQGSGMHPEAVSRDEFISAVDDFCSSER
jgi:hypothetical protein